MDVLVEAALKFADLYTLGMFAVPIAALAFAWKLRETAWLAVSLVAFAAVAVPSSLVAWNDAQAACRSYRAQSARGQATFELEGGEIRYVPATDASAAASAAYWDHRCDQVLSRF
jgi:hypothetical protein